MCINCHLKIRFDLLCAGYVQPLCIYFQSKQVVSGKWSRFGLVQVMFKPMAGVCVILIFMYKTFQGILQQLGSGRKRH